LADSLAAEAPATPHDLYAQKTEATKAAKASARAADDGGRIRQFVPGQAREKSVPCATLAGLPARGRVTIAA